MGSAIITGVIMYYYVLSIRIMLFSKIQKSLIKSGEGVMIHPYVILPSLKHNVTVRS